jgi:hypothetical protein
MTASHSIPDVILRAGFISGSIDLLAAFTFGATRGITPRQLLQTIASALIGQRAIGNRRSTAILGLILHFLIAFSCNCVRRCEPVFRSAHRAFILERPSIRRSRSPSYEVYRVAPQFAETSVLDAIFSWVVDDSYVLRRTTNLTHCRALFSSQVITQSEDSYFGSRMLSAWPPCTKGNTLSWRRSDDCVAPQRRPDSNIFYNVPSHH